MLNGKVCAMCMFLANYVYLFRSEYLLFETMWKLLSICIADILMSYLWLPLISKTPHHRQTGATDGWRMEDGHVS